MTLQVTEADWAHNRLRLGLELTSDFSDSSTYGIVAMHVATALNDWGAELRTIARIGTRRSLAAEWWQPLGAGSHWYVAPSAGYGAGAMDIFMPVGVWHAPATAGHRSGWPPGGNWPTGAMCASASTGVCSAIGC